MPCPLSAWTEQKMGDSGREILKHNMIKSAEKCSLLCIYLISQSCVRVDSFSEQLHLCFTLQQNKKNTQLLQYAPNFLPIEAPEI